MNADFEVRILRLARNDVDSILTWISKQSPLGAKRWYEAFQRTANSLSTEPYSHALAPEASMVTEPVRQTFFKTKSGRLYRLVFLIVDQQVRILRVRGPGQELLQADELE
jgi:plasmid stabilization system protein ParE